MKTCSTCRFFTDHTRVPHCRRYPPTVSGELSSQSAYVPASSWCGEHRLSAGRVGRKLWGKIWRRRDNNSVS
jgi:hypothetical protein